MARGRVRLEWDQTALLWATLAEPHRDPTSRSEPFTPADVHPLLIKECERDDGGPDWALWSKITRNVNVTTIDLTKLQAGEVSE